MTQILKWQDSLSTGIEEIDLQHKKLIKVIDEVYQNSLLSDEQFSLIFPKSVKKLTEYTHYHFEEEERLMKRFGFPGTPDHEAEHRAFTDEVHRQLSALTKATPNDGYQLYRFLGQWLLSHIARSDQQWAAFVRKQPGAPKS